nr:helix-turn-helix domain-containing protein [Pseudemcibacter aquimaris]
MLRDTRLEHKTSDLEVIANELCIRPHLLKALEEGDFD